MGACGAMLIAFRRVSFLFFAGQMSTQSAHPVQSSGDTWMVNFNPFQIGMRQSADLNPSGAEASCSAGHTLLRITACGHTSTHLPH
jgi:hypothetical protein